MRNKESENLGLLFIGDGATISRTSLLNISVSAQNIPVKVFWNCLFVKGVYMTEERNIEHLFEINFLSTLKIYPNQ